MSVSGSTVPHPACSSASRRTRLRECNDPDNVIGNRGVSPEKLSRPQKRRKRLQALAAHRALAENGLNVKQNLQRQTADDSKVHGETEIERRLSNIERMMEKVCFAFGLEPDCAVPASSSLGRECEFTSSYLVGDFRSLPTFAWERSHRRFYEHAAAVSDISPKAESSLESEEDNTDMENELELEKESLSMDLIDFKRLICLGVLRPNKKFETGFMGICTICNEELAATWFQLQGTKEFICTGCKDNSGEDTSGVTGCFRAAFEDDVKVEDALRDGRASDLGLEDMEVNHPSQTGWPDLTVEQQSDFQVWFSSRMARRQEVLESSLEYEVGLAEQMQSEGRGSEVRDRISRAKQLQHQLNELKENRLEDMRQQSWIFLSEQRNA